MATRDILVAIDNAATLAQRLAPAAVLAAAEGARLTGLFASGLPVENAYGDLSGWMQVVEAFLESQRAAASVAEAAFRQELAQRKLTGDWLYRESDATDTAIALAPLYDLVVIGQANPDAEPTGARTLQPEAVVLGCGRPVLVVPYAGNFAEIGRHVLVGWNGSREATRALHDAMSMLQRAEAVTIVEVAGAAEPDAMRVPAAELAAALGRRGVRASAETAPSGDISIEDLLLSRAADLGADLLVMGAYGHSRLREYVLGGPSRGIFRHMTVPVLMAH
ncbi:MAG TPA: universal stress protein [Stellaceae bacterium]|nr:universal stress protein [Stellaceae bacterium]